MNIVSRKSIGYKFSDKAEPVMKVHPGEQILFETLDAHSGTVPYGDVGEDVGFEDLDENNANPISGLVYVENAEVGDTLAVKIVKIDLVGIGFIPVRPKTGVITDMVPKPLARVIHIKDDKWKLNEKWDIPLRPMVGTIGTAVAGEGIAAMHPGDHGGNMDNNFIREGAVVHLPVNVPGALLGLGDVHAAMGDTESTGGGIDICADVLVKVDVIKNGGLSRKPYIVYDGLLITCGHGSDIKTAIKTVTEDTISILSKQMGITAVEAYQLISAIGDVNISQGCNCPGVNATSRVAIPMFWNK